VTFVWTNDFLRGIMNIDITGFDWDKGNQTKCLEHGLSLKEIEAFFQKKNLFISPDIKHSQEEERFLAIGKGAKNKLMLAVFTLRKEQGSLLIRPISARYMHDKEARKYDEENTKIKK